jgi:MYXO-CTERM domain-containing protein
MGCGWQRLGLVCGVFLVSSTASAAVVWEGDLETGDASQYNYLLNPTINDVDYLTIVQDVVAQGDYAARIELHNDAVWGNGLKRVEMQHAPDAGRTAEGEELFFAWSFYLPETLPTDPSQTIGYWETNNSYQQMMAFQLSGDTLSFVTRQPQNMVQWTGDGVATPGQWHRIAMRVLWSTDSGTGEVDVWFDGQQVVTAASAQTLADANSTFAQIGLLRGAIEFDDVPVIYIDYALEGDSLEDVDYDALPTEGGTGSTGGSTGADGTGGGDTTTTTTSGGTTTGPATTGTSSTTAATGTTGADGTGTDTDGTAEAGGDDSGCGCVTSDRPTPWGVLLLMLLTGLRRRRD